MPKKRHFYYGNGQCRKNLRVGKNVGKFRKCSPNTAMKNKSKDLAISSGKQDILTNEKVAEAYGFVVFREFRDTVAERGLLEKLPVLQRYKNSRVTVKELVKIESLIGYCPKLDRYRPKDYPSFMSLPTPFNATLFCAFSFRCLQKTAWG